MKTLLPLLFLAAAPLQQPAAQESDSVYRLDFTIHETNAKQPAKDHHYSLLAMTNDWSKIRAGSKIPYMTEKDKFSYAEIGVNIDCRLQERNARLFMNGKFELSSTESSGTLPQIQDYRSDMTGSLEPGKLTKLAAIDDPQADHHYVIEVVATKM